MTPEDTEKDMCPILILYDDNLEEMLAIPVENKGAVQFVVSWCVSVLEMSSKLLECGRHLQERSGASDVESQDGHY